jgi:predicted TIM-barrel fold metal-dependent hydrolase
MPGLFDAHFHVIDPRFPLVANDGFVPEPFTAVDYLDAVEKLGLEVNGGAVVSGSFQAFDQTYLLDAALDVPVALGVIAAVDPGALLFGTDLPSTRARRPFLASDLDVLAQALPDEARLRGARHDNARRLYRPSRPSG